MQTEHPQSASTNGPSSLGEVAQQIGNRTGMGYVLADAGLYNTPMTLYAAENTTNSQLVSMFDAALHSVNLQAIEKDGFWIIQAPPVIPPKTPTSLQNTKGGIIIDLSEVPLSHITRTLSESAGLQFIISPKLVRYPVTIQALHPVPPEEALKLLRATLAIDDIYSWREGNTITISLVPRPRVRDEGGDIMLPFRDGTQGNQTRKSRTLPPL